MTPPPRALILDLGNVLMFHDNARLFRELGAACGREPDEIQHLILTADAGRHIDLTDGPPEIVYEVVARATGFPGDFTAFAAIWNGIFTLNDPVFPILESLHGRLPLVVLSNTNPLHMAHLRAHLPALNLFDTVLASYEIGAMKPDPASYARAVAAAGVAPHEAAFFDDLPGHVAGAERAGLRSFLFTDAVAFAHDLIQLGLLSPPPSTD